MSKLWVCLACLVLTFSAKAAEQKFADWSHLAPVELGRTPERGLVEVKLTPEVFDLAQPGLADLRVASEAEGEIACAVRAASGTSREIPVEKQLINRSYISGKQSTVVADFQKRVLKNRIHVITSGANFRRKVMVEASDDGEKWQKVRENALIFKVPGDAAVVGWERDLVSLPDNNQQYLRVTVYSGPDDPERIEIENVRAEQVIAEPPQTEAVPIVGSKIAQNEKEKFTEIVLDLGCRNLPLHEIKLDFKDPYFFRMAEVSGRNTETIVIKKRVEDAPALEKVEEAPWNRVTAGGIYRFSGSGAPEESLTISLGGGGYRFLRIRIYNGDDRPLEFSGASITRISYYANFQPKIGGRYTLYLGNEHAVRPSYDLARYVERVRSEGVTAGKLGKAVENPAHGKSEELIPWSERHKIVLWVALLAGLGALVLLVLRQARAARVVESQEKTGRTDRILVSL